MGFVLVQHLDPIHKSALPQILSRVTALPVQEATDNQPVEANHVYIIPRDQSLTIRQGMLRLTPRARRQTLHRPIDSFFESLAADQRERAIGIVLSGTASDGTLGLEAIKAEGGITFAQDDSAKYDSMPRSAIAAGCVDRVLSPSDIAGELARIARHPYVVGQPFKLLPPSTRPEENRAEAIAQQKDGAPQEGERQADDEVWGADTTKAKGYRKIMSLLRNRFGVDFMSYKSATIRRRIARRIILSSHRAIGDYVKFLRGDPQELDALFSDVLIGVTSFFRNAEVFETLQQEVLPKLMTQRGDNPIRCWVQGCSTGQEAYSIAISFMESVGNAVRPRRMQIFATDLSEKSLAKARVGLYAKTLVQDISPERLRNFFVEEQGGYRIMKELREMVVFARQNLVADPPFSRMDIISCRNLLIYLDSSLQQKALATFHYALNPKGVLILGASESVGGFTDLFVPMDQKHKIFTKMSTQTPTFYTSGWKERGEQTRESHRLLPQSAALGGVKPLEGFRHELNAQREADRIAVSQFAPPGVLINSDSIVLQFRGQTEPYLQPPTGRARFDVLEMAREGLMLPLRTAINKAKKENRTARTEHVWVSRNGVARTIHLEVIPLKSVGDRCFLVCFEEAGKSQRAAAPPSSPSAAQDPGRIAELEAELFDTRDYLQAIQEQHDAANEELQSAGEEVQSSNEELQSVNEELETSKEELESANEELMTVNEEMTNRNAELNRLYTDLVNFQASAKLAIVLLGRDLTLRRFSPQAGKQFNLQADDLGRSIDEIRHTFVSDDPANRRLDLKHLIAKVISELVEQEYKVRDKDDRWYSLVVRPYVSLDNKVDGAVLVLQDIDAFTRSVENAAAARTIAENTVHTVREPLLVLDEQLRVESANNAFYSAFNLSPSETIGKLLYDLDSRQWDIPSLRELLVEIQLHRTGIDEFQIESNFSTLGHRTMVLNARRIDDQQRKTKRILLSIVDVTDRKEVEHLQAKLAAILEWSDEAIIDEDLDGVIAGWNRGAQRLFGYAPEEAVGRLVSILISPDGKGEGLDHREWIEHEKNHGTTEYRVPAQGREPGRHFIDCLPPQGYPREGHRRVNDGARFFKFLPKTRNKP